MDAGTVTFICGVIACCVGVATFITGMLTRAKQDGQLIAKLDSALKGIEEIKGDVKSIQNIQNAHENEITQINTELRTLKEKVSDLEDKIWK